MSVGFEIPAEQVPEDSRSLADMVNFLNDVNTGYDFTSAQSVWEKHGYSPEVLGDFISFAQSLADHVRNNGVNDVINLTSLYEHWDFTFLEANPDLTKEMIEAFNASFWNGRPERLIAIQNLARNTLVILGGIPPVNIKQDPIND